MRGISLDAKCPHFLMLESSLDLMPRGTRNLSSPRRITRTAATPAQFSSQRAFTVMRLAERAFQRQTNARPRKAVRVAQAFRGGSAHCPATPLRVMFLFARAGSIVAHGVAARVAQKGSQRLRKSSRLRDPNPV